MRTARSSDLEAVRQLLGDTDLPTAGVKEHLGQFVLMEDGHVLGVAGLEVHGAAALLRSVAVRPDTRGQGVATALVQYLIDTACALGLTNLYLLTTTAETYFPRFGFTVIPRRHVPPALLASREFQDACPTTATLMHLSLKETLMTQTIPGLTTSTNTTSLVAALRKIDQRPLHFLLNGEVLVPAGYHVTEVKAVTIESMDCGGKANAWRETVIQLMDGNEEEARAGFMTNRKFLGIYDRVTKSIPVRGEAEVRFEYGNARTPAMQYHVHGIEEQSDRVVVHLGLPGVQCKASGACGPSTQATAAGEACAPESGCCGPSPVQLIDLETLR